MEGGQFARNVNLGRLETNKRILDLNRYGPSWVTESA